MPAEAPVTCGFTVGQRVGVTGRSLTFFQGSDRRKANQPVYGHVVSVTEAADTCHGTASCAVREADGWMMFVAAADLEPVD
jgi:hypothetical protein